MLTLTEAILPLECFYFDTLSADYAWVRVKLENIDFFE